MRFKPNFPTVSHVIAVARADDGKIVFTAKNWHGWFHYVNWSGNGRKIAALSDDGVVRIWDVASETLARLFRLQDDTVYCLQLDDDGKRLAAGTQDGRVLVVDVQSGKIAASGSAHSDRVNQVVWSAGDKLLASLDDHNAIHLWDPKTGRVLHTLQAQRDHITHLSSTLRGDSLLSADYAGTIKIWNSATGQLEKTLRVADHTLGAIAQRGNETWYVGAAGSASADGARQIPFALWRSAASRINPDRNIGHSEIGLRMSPDGRWYVTAGKDGAVHVWDSASDRELVVLEAPSLLRAVVSDNGQKIVALGRDGVMRVWETASWGLVTTIHAHRRVPESLALAVSPDGSLAASSDHQEFKVWDLKTGSCRLARNSWLRCTALAFSKDGKALIACYGNGMVVKLTSEDGQVLALRRAHNDYVNDVVFSSDGRFFATASDDHTIRLWDAAACRSIRQFTGHTNEVSAVSFVPDGSRLVTAGEDRTVRVWSTETGQELLALPSGPAPADSLALTPDGTRPLTKDADGTVKVWKGGPAHMPLELKGHLHEVTAIAFSPDGSQIATGSQDKTARLWNATTGEELSVFKGHQAGLTTVGFSADGEWLISGGLDATAKIWDAATGAELKNFAWYREGSGASCAGEGTLLPITHIAISPDKQLLVTASKRLTSRDGRLEFDLPKLTASRIAADLAKARWEEAKIRARFRPRAANRARLECFGRQGPRQAPAGRGKRPPRFAG